MRLITDPSFLRVLLLAGSLAVWAGPHPAYNPESNLIANPGFETLKTRDPFGRVFANWEGEKSEGDCTFEIGLIPHTGKTSALLACPAPGKIRIAQTVDLQPGRYAITASLRGLDIEVGNYQENTEFMFDGKYFPLRKNGSFGWTRLTYVVEVTKPIKAGPSFGLWASGLFWIDDVTMERVGSDAKLTDTPVLGNEEAPMPKPPGSLGPGAVRCPRCRNRNMPEWEKCYACGSSLNSATSNELTLDPVKTITSFEDGNPFDRGAVVAEHATDGTKALRIDPPYSSMISPQDWSGYDYLVVDTYTDTQPAPLVIEIRDAGTTDYWTRVNYWTTVPPGHSKLVVPLKQLYVGEKGHPGRMLILNRITRLVFVLNGPNSPPLFIDHLRLERDTAAQTASFEGLQAFDFGTATSPVMPGFTSITPATLYSPGRGYGLKDARIWRAVDALQPDPLYQDFICIESGGLAVDLPNGTYRVFVNMDSPSGLGGEYQAYRRRSILAQGKEVLVEKQDFTSFQKKYFQFWDTEDLPSDSTFDKYDRAHFQGKMFDVEVKNKQLSIEFSGEHWACSVSAIIIFPLEKAAEGARFLELLREKRRFYFDNTFKRVLHRGTGDPLQATAVDTERGYVVFQRDFMKDVYYNDTPFRSELGKPLVADTFPGQEVPVAVAVLPLQDLGKSTVSVSALSGPQSTIPASNIDVGYISYRLTRVTMDGAVYTISPRFIIPKNSVTLSKGTTRAFWLTIRTPAGTNPGTYTGQVTITPERGGAVSLPLRLLVRTGALDPVDIPVGPWGARMGVPWFEDDPAAMDFGADMTEKSLRSLRAHGFTMFSGVPYISYQGFQGRTPLLDFRFADSQMKVAKSLGFLAVNSYGAGVHGLDAYNRDTAKMTAAGFTSYSAFIQAIYAAIQKHAQKQSWLPVYWNIGDEPAGDRLKESIENARAYRAAFPAGPPFFTAATSLVGHQTDDPHFTLAETLHIANLTLHDETNVQLFRQRGGEWAFYNAGSPWTFGVYLYKAVKQFNMKFRLAWHWNAVAGDPYYALDCREDDFAWANASPDRNLVPSLEYARIAAGLSDYRGLLTLARLARHKEGAPAANAARALIEGRMAAFHLGDLDHDRLFGIDDWTIFREQVAHAIEALQ